MSRIRQRPDKNGRIAADSFRFTPSSGSVFAPTPAPPDRSRCPTSVAGRLQLKCNVPGEGPKSKKEMIWLLCHQMNIQRFSRHLGNRLRYRWAKRKIIYKVSIHDIDMKPVGSGFFRPNNFLAYSRKVAREYRRRDDSWLPAHQG